MEPGLSAAKRFLIKWVCDCWKRSSLIDAIDPRLAEFSSKEVERVLKVGLLCANLAPSARPSMEQVVQYLNGNLALPEFWPYSPGIGVITPPPQLMLPSLSQLSSSSSNNSMFMTHSIVYGSGRWKFLTTSLFFGPLNIDCFIHMLTPCPFFKLPHGLRIKEWQQLALYLEKQLQEFKQNISLEWRM